MRSVCALAIPTNQNEAVLAVIGDAYIRCEYCPHNPAHHDCCRDNGYDEADQLDGEPYAGKEALRPKWIGWLRRLTVATFVIALKIAFSVSVGQSSPLSAVARYARG